MKDGFDTTLLEVCKLGNLNKVKELICGMDLLMQITQAFRNSQEEGDKIHGVLERALQIAAENGHAEIVKVLMYVKIEHILDSAKRTMAHRKWDTPEWCDITNTMHHYVNATAVDIAYYLDDKEQQVISSKFYDYVNAESLGYQTPLYLAAKNGHVNVVQILLNYRDAENHMNNADTKIFTQLHDSNLAMFKDHIDSADIANSLIIAAENGHTNVIQALLNAGGKVYTRDDNNSKKTLLHIAAENGHDDLIRFLANIDRRFINSRDQENRTPLDLSVKEST